MNTSSDSTTDGRSQLRLKIVCPRFWPFSGSTEFAAGDLAEALANAGVNTEVITAGWDKATPATFGFRNFRVQRIYRSPSSPWGSHRYQKNLRRYLVNSSADGIIFFDAFSEFRQLAKLLSDKSTVISRIHDHQLSQFSNRNKNWQRHFSPLKMADRVIVESDQTKIDLVQAGIAHENIFVSDDIISQRPPVQGEFTCQLTARQAISAAHPMLTLPPDQPLVVCGAAMFGDKGMLDLIESWQYVLRLYPQAKLWILGHGTASKNVWERIMARQLTDSIVMLGQFDDLSDVMRAANAYVHPLRSSLNCSMLGRAMSAGLCPILCEPIGQTLGLTNDQNAILAPVANPQQLASAILKPIEQAEQHIGIGLAAAQWAHHRYDVAKNVDCYLSAFARTPANSQPSPPTPV